MRACLPLSNDPKTGKGLFISRLSVALKSIGVKITSKPNAKHDIMLNIVSIDTKSKAKQVVRLDGVIHNSAMNYRKRNSIIGRSVLRADGVIYQSEFCRRVANRYIGKVKTAQAVIFNGADLSFYDSINPAKRKFKHNFIAYARWRPQKRLAVAIESFLEAAVDDSCLYVAGDTKKSGMTPKSLKRFFALPNICYLGIVDQAILASYLKICDASIHLSWIDWCPNSVVEAIACGVPVITNNVGGTKELVGPSGGVVCDIDKDWDLSPCDLYHPPRINVEIVAKAIRSATLSKNTITNNHVDIMNVARSYKKFFERVLA